MLRRTDFTPADGFSTTPLLRQKPFMHHAKHNRNTHIQRNPGVQSTIQLRTFKALACKTQKTALPAQLCDAKRDT